MIERFETVDDVAARLLMLHAEATRVANHPTTNDESKIMLTHQASAFKYAASLVGNVEILELM